MRDSDPQVDGLLRGLRRLPHNIQAEQALLGSILVNNRAYDRVAGFLNADAFAIGEHREIYAAIERTIAAGGVASPVTLSVPCGAECLMAMADAAVSVHDALHYGRLVHDLALRRDLIAAGERIIDTAYTAEIEDTAAVQAESARAALDHISAAAAGASSALPLMTAGEFAALPPPRGWLLGAEVCREFVTMLSASGGSGKTAIAMLWATALATGRAISGHHIHCRSRVGIITAEDNADEIKRRLHAVALRYNIDMQALVADGWLTIAILTGTGSQLLAMIGGEAVDTGLAQSIDSVARARRLDCIIVDPWIKVAGAPENDNAIMDRAINKLVGIASRRSIGVVVLHHHKKGSETAGDREMARGASSLIDAVRIGRTVTTMREEDAERHGIPEAERRQYKAVTDAKLNLTPYGEAEWYKIEGVALGNQSQQYPSGDNVQAAVRWYPPPPCEADPAHDDMIVGIIAAGTPDGERYTESNRASAGHRSAVNAVLKAFPDKTKGQAREIIARLMRSGRIVSRSYHSQAQRKERMGLFSADE